MASLLIPGFKLKTPFDLKNVGTQEEFAGKEYPTYFKLLLSETKQCPINKKFRVQYETDAVNDYLKRDELPGKFDLLVEGQEDSPESILNLWNGLATLTVTLPEKASIGDIIKFKSIVNDPTQFKPFEATFEVIVLKEAMIRETRPGKRIEVPLEEEGNKRAIPAGLSLPQVIEVHREEWTKFNFDENSVLNVKDTGEEGYDFYVNMDNIHLLSEIKTKSNIDAKLLQERYKYAFVLIGFALLKDDSNGKEKNNNEKDVLKEVSETTKRLSPIILPMISYLGELEI